MCGIMGYYGTRNGTMIVQKGLQTLSYRGYDSWGLAIHQKDDVVIKKGTGDITKIPEITLSSSKIIGHTRWATHGGVTEKNAHPHTNKDKTITVVHNGIIENYLEIKKELIALGYEFQTETDTEVIPQLIDFFIKKGEKFENAFKKTIQKLEGSYAILSTSQNSESICFARKGSPLVIGIGEQEYYLSSDVLSFIDKTDKIIYLDDNEYGYINGRLQVYKNENNSENEIKKEIKTINNQTQSAEKGNYPHYLIKEINEQRTTIPEALNQDFSNAIQILRNASTVFLVGCGTSYNTCATANYQFAKTGKITIPIMASEFEQYSNLINDKTAIIAVSQSGETADVLDAIKTAKQKKAKIIAIVNVLTSTLARESDVTIPMKTGPEISVLSTKTCTAQLAILIKIANMIVDKKVEFAVEKLEEIFLQEEKIKKIAKKISNSKNMFVIGRKQQSQIAKEGALKIKEVSYIHAEGMPAGELKHGSIALIEKDVPVIVICDEETQETNSNAMEVKARGAYVIGISTKTHPCYDEYIEIPDCGEMTPLFSVIPLQLLAYHLAIERKCNPDKPRNLAKSVTVK